MNQPRLFASDAAVRHIGEGLLACSLAKAEWTHEAHLAAGLWILVERPDLAPEGALPGLIRRHNESVGGVNDDHEGYHHSITLTFAAGVRAFLRRTDPALGLAEKVNLLLDAPEGERGWPLRFFSEARLFSVEARRGWIEPDLGPLPS